MSFENARSYLSDRGYGDRIQVFDVSSATVELFELSGAKAWIDVCASPE